MKIGIGLPNTVPGTTGAQMREWAIRAEAAGFSSLGTIDRLLYGNHESLIALSYAAAVTERIGLMTSVLLAPLRTNTLLLAKQAASLDVLSGGRLTLALAVGGRDDDYEASGVDFAQRGKLFDQQLEALQRPWTIEPSPGPGRPEILIGGRVPAAFRRAARFDGWMMGGGAPDTYGPSVAQLHQAWQAAGREGQPRQPSLGYFGLGGGAREQVRSYITDYYAFIGAEASEGMAASIPADGESVRAVVKAFEDAGCDEFVLFPTSNDPKQVDLLAEAVL